MASSVPSVCSTFALIFVVDTTAPAVLRFAAVMVGAVSEPPVFTSTSLPVAVSDVAAVTVPEISAPSFAASVSAAIVPPFCVSLPVRVISSFASPMVPPFCVVVPETASASPCATTLPPFCSRFPPMDAVVTVARLPSSCVTFPLTDAAVNESVAVPF